MILLSIIVVLWVGYMAFGPFPRSLYPSEEEMNTQGTCKDCKYWERYGIQEFGGCPKIGGLVCGDIWNPEEGCYVSVTSDTTTADFGCIKHKPKEGKGKGGRMNRQELIKMTQEIHRMSADTGRSILTTIGQQELDFQVDRFCEEIKSKLAKKHNQGKSGWSQEWPIEDIKQQLIEHIEKGDPVDVANYALFWWYHSEGKYEN